MPLYQCSGAKRNSFQRLFRQKKDEIMIELHIMFRNDINFHRDLTFFVALQAIDPLFLAIAKLIFPIAAHL